MAYGSHHFLANFKFQCEAREHLLFGEVPRRAGQASLSFDKYLFLTQQGYARALAPVNVGARVCILLSIEEPTLSSTRFCFRVVGEDGTPVSCGYQTVVCLSRETHEVVPAPEALRPFEQDLRERLRHPSFAERVSAGDLNGIFDEEVLGIGRRLASAPAAEAYPQVVFRSGEINPAPRLEVGPVFLFPGQGSYAWPLLGELRLLSPEYERRFREINGVTTGLLGAPFLDLAAAAEHAHRAIVREHPELIQVAMYTVSALVADYLMNEGVTPSALVGHSAGELAALAAAGAYDLIAGAEVVCHRAAALRKYEGGGGMVALGAGAERVRRLLSVLAPSSLWLAALNHAEQTVVSGTETDLVRLTSLAAHLGISAHCLPAPYPFHSPLLEGARKSFSNSLGHLPTRRTSCPVYSPIRQSWYSEGLDLATALPGHFVERLDFGSAVTHLEALGARRFVECGGRTVLSNLVKAATARGSDGVRVWPSTARGIPLSLSLHALVSELRGEVSAGPEQAGGTGRGGVRASSSQNQVDDASEPEVTAEIQHTGGREESPEPVAIVSLGCVLPGASDAERFWKNIEAGRTAIQDGARLSAEHATDFLAADGAVDKTYTLLSGIIGADDQPQLPAGIPARSWSLSQRWLASSLLQCLAGLQTLPKPGRVQMIVGSTADGTVELDEAILQLEVERIADEVHAGGVEHAHVKAVVEGLTGRGAGDVVNNAPSRAWRAVARALLGEEVKTYAVDAACASSLYSTALGVAALRDGDCDLAFAGGVFSPGPVNSCLFSQFRGLSATGSRPFDACADGVVFSQGAGMLALKRLGDAIEDGDKIHAVIRGAGLSSDGRSASVTEPKKVGQQLAMERAYGALGVEPGTVQFIEAHATSTSVGDTVELKAIQEVFGSSAADGGPLALGSVKSLIGHTGWAAGAASLIKVCAALAARIIPGQPNFSTPNPALAASGTRATVPTSHTEWRRRGPGPRRAAVSGFGFGGANAHVVLEEFEEAAHARVRPVSNSAKPHTPLAVVGFSGLFPPGRGRIDDALLSMPEGRHILPDAAEQMDRSQMIALAAAVRALDSVGDAWKNVSDETGIVLGFEGKTEKSVHAIRRVYADFVKRRMREQYLAAHPPLSEQALSAATEQILRSLRSEPCSNAYSLAGLMPNLIAGRVANMLNLRGPNFVVDAGADSLRQALECARAMLRHGSCSLVLAGGVGAAAGRAASLMYETQGRPLSEGAVVLAVTTREFARERGLAVKGYISPASETGDAAGGLSVGETGEPYMGGAEGGVQLVRALESCRAGHVSVVFRSDSAGRSQVTARVESTGPAVKPQAAGRFGDVILSTQEWHPLAEPAERTPARARGRVLALVDGPTTATAIAGHAEVFLCPKGAGVPRAEAVDVGDDGSARAGLLHLDSAEFDTILVAKDLGSAPEDGSWEGPAGGQALLELLFVVTRHFYRQIESGRVSLLVLNTSAGRGESVHPLTGLFGGFVKSLAREMPGARCRAVHIDGPLEPETLSRAVLELERPASDPAEVYYRGGRAGHFTLRELKHATRDGAAAVEDGDVVLATGGARGVTAVLCESLLRRAGCHLVLVGRTDPACAPAHVTAMDDGEFERLESEFYREELARTPGARPALLRARFRQIRGAREVALTVARLRRIWDSVEYRCLDITDGAAVEALIADVARERGRLDFILHGAGLQASRRTDLKSLAEFRGIIDVKLGGLRNLMRAARRHLPRDAQPDFHLLTSAFSFFGNDGQPDYGAANEALGRLAAHLSGQGSRVTAVGWLGWADLGMTRGSEYAALARSRGLKGLSQGEGQAIFEALLEGTPAAANNVLVSPGEMNFYGVECLPPEPAAEPLEWHLSPGRQPFLLDHRVNAVPTLPGTFEVELAVKSASRLCPGRTVISVEDARFVRFVKVGVDSHLSLRAPARVVHEDERETVVRVELRSDFTHASGLVLKPNVLHFSAYVRLSSSPPAMPPGEVTYDGRGGTAVPDPYVHERAPVWLGGGFRGLHDIRLNGEERAARFYVRPQSMFEQLKDFLIPAVLLDSLCRFAMIRREPDGTLPVFVPVTCRRLLVRPGLNDAALVREGREVDLRARTPYFDGEVIRNARAEAVSSDGVPILVVEDLAARPMGSVTYD